MEKVHISRDMIKPFSSKGDVVVWLKKVRLMDDVANLLPLYTLEMDENDQRNINQIEARLKEVFTNNAFTAYSKLTAVR